MKTYRWLAVAGAAIVLGAAACGGGSGSSAPATTTMTTTTSTAAAPGSIGTAQTSLGQTVVDANGMTLYLFEKDTGGMSSCTGECATFWPPVTVTGTPTGGSGIDAAKLGTTTRPDGTKQVTYDGHPLYLYAGDSSPGDTNGQALDKFGAEWYALSPDGSAITTSSSSGGGGYGSGGY